MLEEKYLIASIYFQLHVGIMCVVYITKCVPYLLSDYRKSNNRLNLLLLMYINGNILLVALFLWLLLSVIHCHILVSLMNFSFYHFEINYMHAQNTIFNFVVIYRTIVFSHPLIDLTDWDVFCWTLGAVHTIIQNFLLSHLLVVLRHIQRTPKLYYVISQL